MYAVQKAAGPHNESNIPFVNNVPNHYPCPSALPNFTSCNLPPNVQDNKCASFNSGYNYSDQFILQPVHYPQPVSLAVPVPNIEYSHQCYGYLNQPGFNFITSNNFQNNQSDIFNTYNRLNYYNTLQKINLENNNCIPHQNPPSPFIPSHIFQQNTVPPASPQHGLQHITNSQSMRYYESGLAKELNTSSSSEFKVSIL